ncbi:hypothetical protein SRIMM317S_05913 [Streptomyces rimosus subsp. rimosus]
MASQSTPRPASSQGASATYSASARPASVSEKSFLPPSLALLISPSSSRSWRVGYTEPGLGFQVPPLRLGDLLDHHPVSVHRPLSAGQDRGAHIAAPGPAARPAAAAPAAERRAAEGGPDGSNAARRAPRTVLRGRPSRPPAVSVLFMSVGTQTTLLSRFLAVLSA